MRAARARARRAHRVSAQACASSRLAVEEGANYRVSARTHIPRAPVRAASRPPAAAGPPGSPFSRTKATATLLLFRLQSTPEFAAWRSRVLCQDCGEEAGDVPYHFCYHKCPTCGSYNTRVLQAGEQGGGAAGGGGGGGDAGEAGVAPS